VNGNDGLLEARGLGFAHPGTDVLRGLSFRVGPGLTIVRGGDGRGKTTLLRLLAGVLAPTAGAIERHAASVFYEQPADAAHDQVVAKAWLDAQRARHAGWNDELVSALAEAFVLVPHLGKPLFMLSAGSRRKVGLVAAAASGAPLTLLDTPFAALDAASARVLADVLAEAAEDTARAWVVADHEIPAVLQGVALAGVIDLGD
jgi:ABC-type transport system involved in cytochrome c biogenesis ATPase subunit